MATLLSARPATRLGVAIAVAALILTLGAAPLLTAGAPGWDGSTLVGPLRARPAPR
jgi:hypothetical protein